MKRWMLKMDRDEDARCGDDYDDGIRSMDSSPQSPGNRLGNLPILRRYTFLTNYMELMLTLFAQRAMCLTAPGHNNQKKITQKAE